MPVIPANFSPAYKRAFGPMTKDTDKGFNELLTMINADPGAANLTSHEVAYVLATVWHETWKPKIQQRWVPTIESGKPAYFEKYEPNTALGKKLGNRDRGDGMLYRGRGYVMITGRANYERLGPIVDPNRPDILLGDGAWLAAMPLYAYPILMEGMKQGLFTGKSLGDYFLKSAGDGPDDLYDFVWAREIVNGKRKGESLPDRAEDIAVHAREIHEILIRGELRRDGTGS